MVDLGCKVDDWRFERIVGWEVEVEFEVAALKGAVRRGCCS